MKTITAAELARMKVDGAEVLREKREVSVEGLAELAAYFERLAAAAEEVARKRNEETIAAIDRLTKAVASKNVDMPDLNPILEELVALQKAQLIKTPPAEYTFDIKRNSRQFMTQVVARPLTPTEH